MPFSAAANSLCSSTDSRLSSNEAIKNEDTYRAAIITTRAKRHVEDPGSE